MSWVRMLSVIVLVAWPALAVAKSSLNLEVHEPSKSRLIAADVWIRTPAGAFVSKLFAAAGRLRLADAPVGTFDIEARSRQGNLVGNTRVVIALRPAPPVKAQAKQPPPQPQRPGLKPATAPRTPQAATPPTTPPPTGPKTATIGGTLSVKDWGKGASKVCRGDVFDAKGRRIWGTLQLLAQNQPIGFAKVVAGYFSLYDLKTATYQLRFTSSDGQHKATTNAPIVAGKLAKVVLKAP